MARIRTAEEHEQAKQTWLKAVEAEAEAQNQIDTDREVLIYKDKLAYAKEYLEIATAKVGERVGIIQKRSAVDDAKYWLNQPHR